jgi:hypothetical protein
MSTDSVGQVSLDLGLNYSQFNSQLSGIAKTAQSTTGKAFLGLGKIMVAAFSIRAIYNFGKASIELASDLSEVQNVVDVTFGGMAQQINEFSKSTLNAFGLSELSAKSYSSTMGAMLKSSGLTGEALVDLSTDLTGLAGDMASFYNLDTDTAFSKIRSGISGETEPLKQLGVNLSVANLEAYALSQGMTKAYSSMTEAEKVLLRYNYLMSVTADAQGDFARTSNSWANQTRLLSEQFNILKTTLGQGFINVLTPIVTGLNFIISKLQVAAEYFTAFTSLIFGKSSTGNSISSAASSATSS